MDPAKVLKTDVSPPAVERQIEDERERERERGRERRRDD
jgi:hypothetical protein